MIHFVSIVVLSVLSEMVDLAQHIGGLDLAMGFLDRDDENAIVSNAEIGSREHHETRNDLSEQCMAQIKERFLVDEEHDIGVLKKSATPQTGL